MSYSENGTDEIDLHIFFSKDQGKFTVFINKRTLLCKEVNKEFSFFLKVHDKFAIVQQKLNTWYLFIISKGL